MRKFILIALTLVLLATSVAPALAAPPRDTTYVVQPGDTLYSIARRFGVTVSAIVAANDIANPSLIFPGQTLVIPGAAGTTTTTTTPGATPGSGAGAGFTVTAGTPIYSGDGRVVDIPITVTNNSVQPAIAGGRHTATLKPDGNYEDAALFKASHDGDFEQPLFGDGELWQATVYLSDGTTHVAGVGCRFLEQVHAEGDEPLERTPEGVWVRSFHYEIDLYDGWFDCGNSYRVNPADIAPGASGSSVLTIYLVNPHDLAAEGKITGTPYPGRKVTRLDVKLFKPNGSVAGTTSLNIP